jgi:hypothetical protein
MSAKTHLRKPLSGVLSLLSPVCARMNAALPFVLVCLLAGCPLDDPLSPSEERDLRRSRALWDQKGSDDYTVESRISCFCSPHLNYLTRLTVRGGVVVQAEPVSPLPHGVEPLLQGWVTVDELFDRVRDDHDFVRDVSVRFDRTLGYPLQVSITCHSNVTDCGVTYTMQNLTIPQGDELRSALPGAPATE